MPAPTLRSSRAEDLKAISSPIDFVGLNVYMPNHYVVAGENGNDFALLPFAATYPHMDSSWLRIGPEAMYWAPRHVAKLWNVKSIYITENGTSAADQPCARTARSTISIASCTCATI